MAIVNPWNATFNDDPLGTDLVSMGDDEIRSTRDTVRDVLRVEHDVGDATVHLDWRDTGRHNPGSARTFFGPLAFTDLVRPTNAGAFPPIATNPDRSASSTLDNGRLWIDADDCQPYFREQEEYDGANWTDLNTNELATSAAWVSLWPRSNLVTDAAGTGNNLNGAGANTREAIDTLSVSVYVPDDGRVYRLFVTANIKYAIVGSDHIGLWLMDDTPTELDTLLVSNTSGNLIGEATLQRLVFGANLVPGTTYVYTVEWAASDAANCYINPSAANPAISAAAAGDFVGVTTTSRITATLMPYYAAY